MDDVKTTRNSNIEMLRIIAMCMIIGHHYRVWSTSGGVNFSVNSFLGLFFNMGGKYGVDLFVIISSYFLVDSEFKLDRIVRTWMKTWLYSIIFLIGALIWNPSLVGGKSLIMSVLPVTYKNYWFITAYIGLLIVSPYLNILFRNLTKKQHFALAAILTVMYSLWPSVLIKSSTYFSQFGMFITIYTVVAFLKRYHMLVKKMSKALIGAVGIYFLIFLAGCIFICLGELMPDKKNFWDNCKVVGFSEYSIVLLVSAIFLFYAFILMPRYKNRMINLIGQSTFGMYLIHDNYFFREFLWGKLLHAKDYLYSNIYFMYSVFAVIVVFVVSFCIEILFEKLWKICKINFLIEKAEYKIILVCRKNNKYKF